MADETLIVCLTAGEAVITPGRTFALWDRERDRAEWPRTPEFGYYEPPFPDPSIFDGVTRVAYSQSAMREALDFTSAYGEDVRVRFRWFANLGRWH